MDRTQYFNDLMATGMSACLIYTATDVHPNLIKNIQSIIDTRPEIHWCITCPEPEFRHSMDNKQVVSFTIR